MVGDINCASGNEGVGSSKGLAANGKIVAETSSLLSPYLRSRLPPLLHPSLGFILPDCTPSLSLPPSLCVECSISWDVLRPPPSPTSSFSSTPPPTPGSARIGSSSHPLFFFFSSLQPSQTTPSLSVKGLIRSPSYPPLAAEQFDTLVLCTLPPSPPPPPSTLQPHTATTTPPHPPLTHPHSPLTSPLWP